MTTFLHTGLLEDKVSDLLYENIDDVTECDTTDLRHLLRAYLKDTNTPFYEILDGLKEPTEAINGFYEDTDIMITDDLEIESKYLPKGPGITQEKIVDELFIKYVCDEVRFDGDCIFESSFLDGFYSAVDDKFSEVYYKMQENLYLQYQQDNEELSQALMA